MANIMLLANLNCDRVLALEEPLQAGGRHHYRDLGRRLGGGGANTGLGLVWAGHHVALVSQIGRDETADWLLAEASLQGLNCGLLHRNDIVTPELMLLMTPDGERTIIRPERPRFVLGKVPALSQWDALYINTSAEGVESWAQAAVNDSQHALLVVAQLPKGEEHRPCHVLITSKSDLTAHRERGHQTESDCSVWEYGVSVAGQSLRYFIVTDGEHGATAYSQDDSVFVPAVNTEVIDTTGAGDAFAAGVIHGLLSDKPIDEAMQDGAKWASFAVATSSSIPGGPFKAYIQVQ
ncbi:PfkB family carbohydrate kinase [Photobacterium aphoticum]|uniref:Ribokinase n=1 Tax=Photobacterium aphoticum TaxID=754436 RepID=A0A0J1GRP1_9GAMM|nr:PfkB family carbohydrate kinase [Photobacterium aphoticum]KLV02084.1 ribokinase [Photobacterium aphoticum]PSU60336.1 ribokinase [Photobacterium aphoticum]GHA35000.1 ribokinase [Photobacterium aphoticum]